MHLSGAILPVSPAIAVISIVWVNKGAFKAQSWKATTLARMVGWKVIGSAVHSPAAENIVYEHLGKNQFAATGSGEIQYITPGTIDIFANAWHRGILFKLHHNAAHGTFQRHIFRSVVVDLFLLCQAVVTVITDFQFTHAAA